MFVKLAFIFVTFLQISNGLPLETKQPEYDVKSFFSSRIVGGVDVPYGHGKYMVALIIDYYVRMLVCGGSIITRRHVLSAAHCIEPFIYWGELSTRLTGMIGTYYWNASNTEIRFSGYVIHPHWDWNTIKNDIGILITTKEIVYNDHVGPIALSFEHKGGGQLATVIGWGRVEVWGDIPCRAQWLNVTTLSPEQCDIHMKYISQSMGEGPPVDPKVEICTFHSFGHGMCNGDSGSPLTCVRTGKQFGIVSWGRPCAKGAPDIFVRISAYKEWILNHVSLHYNVKIC